jgi:ribosomal protein L37AE/L43A
MTQMAAGIDYGMGLANLDQSTGVRFGVISINELPGWINDEEEADYGEPSCPECGSEDVAHCEDGDGEMRCSSCEHNFNEDDQFPDEPIAWKLEMDGVLMTRSGSDTDYFIVKSPFYTKCQFCSPCAPGAGYVTNQEEDGVKTYCPPPSWYRDHDEMPPFDAFSVMTNRKLPRKKHRKTWKKTYRKYARALPMTHGMTQKFYDYLTTELITMHNRGVVPMKGTPEEAEAVQAAFLRAYDYIWNTIANQFMVHRTLYPQNESWITKHARMALSILRRNKIKMK